MAWGTPVEIEKRNRIFLCIAAYGYEYAAMSLVSDEAFDAAARAINPQMETGNPVMDKFFKEEFSPSTGMWIRKHPDIHGIANRFNQLMKAVGEDT